jgi:tetratricopeptide (TPR) repeat protein
MSKVVSFLFLLLYLGLGELMAQQYSSQDGHVLDANTRVGSFGWNTRIRFDPLVTRMNLLMTGNVRGGQSFQGLLPYQSPAELQSLSAMNTLSDFRRDSTGVRDLSESHSYQGITPYVEKSRQVTRSFGNRVSNTYRVAKDWAKPTRSSRQLLQDQYHVLRPITRLNHSLNVLRPSPVAEPTLYSQAVQQTLWKGEVMRDQAPLAGKPGTLYEALRGDGLLGEPANYNDQVFEMLESQEKSRSEGGDLTWPTAKPATMGTVGDAEASQGETGEGFDEEVESGLFFRGPGGLVQANVTEKIARLNRRQHQSYMEQGNSLMSQGRFYHAANAFGSAVFFAPENGVAILAKSHALFAAGEFMSSAYYLNRAIDLSKDLALSPVDVEMLLGDAEALERRLEDLENWRERTGNPMLYFLQGYVQLRLGHVEEAQVLLEKSQSLAPELVSVQILLASVGEK